MTVSWNNIASSASEVYLSDSKNKSKHVAGKLDNDNEIIKWKIKTSGKYWRKKGILVTWRFYKENRLEELCTKDQKRACRINVFEKRHGGKTGRVFNNCQKQKLTVVKKVQ